MKRIILFAAGVFFTATALHSQSVYPVDDNKSTDELHLTVIPRIDVNPTISTGDGASADINTVSPTLYTVFEGNITDHVSFYLSNHWLAPHPENLYDNTLRSNASSWVDQAILSYNLDCGLSLGAGKIATTFGNFEEFAEDWDAHSVTSHGSILASSYWNGMMTYEWGVNLGYTIDESNSLIFQWLTSPYGEKPFSSNLYGYHLSWSHTKDAYSMKLSGNLIETKRGTYAAYVGWGQRLAFSKQLVGTLDIEHFAEPHNGSFFDQYNSFQATIQYAQSPKLDLTGRLGYERGRTRQCPIGYSDDGVFRKNTVYGGISANYYPLKTRQLRLHATAALHNQYDEAWLSLGATYFLRFDF